DGFYRPRANPDALRAPAPRPGEAHPPLPAATAPATAGGPVCDLHPQPPRPEVPETHREPPASARPGQQRHEGLDAQRDRDAAAPAGSESAPAAGDARQTPTASAAPSPHTSARYLLQAGSFSASGDAEALKARIALLGLGARVESAQVDGRTVYRVRMGPYGTASELADAKGRLERGGLEPLAIKVQ